MFCWKYDIHDVPPAVWALPGAWRGHPLTPGDHTQMARGRGSSVCRSSVSSPASASRQATLSSTPPATCRLPPATCHQPPRCLVTSRLASHLPRPHQAGAWAWPGGCVWGQCSVRTKYSAPPRPAPAPAPPDALLMAGGGGDTAALSCSRPGPRAAAGPAVVRPPSPCPELGAVFSEPQSAAVTGWSRRGPAAAPWPASSPS